MSNTDKKNQHYIPKFYLRNFSFLDNQKQIGIFNLKKQFYFQKAKLKTQGSKNFFYGNDGALEDKLSEAEGVLANGIRKTIKSQWLPKSGSKEHVDLLVFVALTHLRNPVAINGHLNSLELMRKNLLEQHPDTDVDKLVPRLTHEEAVEQSMANLEHVVENIVDLDYKLLINQTSNPFISSDFPVIKYNQFLESRNWSHGKTGYGNMGLQIYIPINDTLAYYLYDSKIYKAGNKRNNYVSLTEKSDVDQLNMLQMLNCHETLYFNERVSEHYMQTLYSNSKQYHRANQETIGVHDLVKSDDKERSKLMILGSTDVEIKLQINGIKMLPSSKFIKLGTQVAQMRTRPAELMNERHSKGG